MMLILFILVVLAFQYDHVTCGTVLKLENVHSKARLHSHDVKYGSGSGQQVNFLLILC